MSSDCFKAYESLIPIEILGRPAKVPENNTLLRCFQYLCPDSVPLGKFCWNNECGNSSFRYRLSGDSLVRHARACCFARVTSGLEIIALSSELEHVLAPFLDSAALVSTAACSAAENDRR